MAITYNISNAYFPVTVALKQGVVPGGATVSTNEHMFAGEYTFEDVASDQYCIVVTDCFGCELVRNVATVENGLLYNFWAVSGTGSSSITSSDDWDIPTEADITTLITYLGGEAVAGGKLKSLLRWNSPNIGATNEVNFNAFGTGVRDETGEFNGILTDSNIGTLTEKTTFDPNDAMAMFTLFSNTAESEIAQTLKIDGIPFRVFRAASVPEQSLADGTFVDDYVGNDGRVYNAVKIGTQVWIVQSLAETLLRDLTPIPEVTDNTAWSLLSTMALCAYNNDWTNVYN